MSNAIKRIFHS